MSFTRICCILICLFVTFFVDAQEVDTPLAGEGIHAFLRRHNRADNHYYQAFIKLNKEKLDKNPALLFGVYYQLPPIVENLNKPHKPDYFDTLDINISELLEGIADIGTRQTKNKNLKTGYQPLFGEKYARYTIVSRYLEGACFFVSSGHGGPDSGAIAKVDGHELHEDEYAYDIALRLARNLLQLGATVHITIQDPDDGIRDGKYLNNSRKETCMGKTIPLNQIERLQQRTDKINSLSAKAKEKYKRAIFIHLDSRSKKKQLDVFFYYQDKQENRVKSKLLAETMRNTFQDRYAKVQPRRGFSGTVSTRNLAVMRKVEPVSIFVELANMQNEFDQRRYILDDNRQALANWMTLGFIRDYRNFR